LTVLNGPYGAAAHRRPARRSPAASPRPGIHHSLFFLPSLGFFLSNLVAPNEITYLHARQGYEVDMLLPVNLLSLMNIGLLDFELTLFLLLSF
jgi:hypothetical protein